MILLLDDREGGSHNHKEHAEVKCNEGVWEGIYGAVIS